MFAWLFPRRPRRDDVIRIAEEFARHIWDEHTADWSDRIGWPYKFRSAELGGNYWYIKIDRVLQAGLWSSDPGVEIWVHKDIGDVDYGENVCRRERNASQ
jgi:hypothetical protein